ncbi:MAG: CDP-diacylglycerol--glycerol-3-phosphate 3-phosphatidyltransferase [bacterium]
MFLSKPNQLTVVRIVLTPFFAACLPFDSIFYKYLALFIFILASFTDWLDGYLARKSGDITDTGMYLDPLADKFLTITAFGMFSFLGFVPFWMFIAIALRGILVTGLRSYALSKNKPIVTSKKAKWKTASQMAAIYLLFVWMIMKVTYQDVVPLPWLIEKVEEWDLVHFMMLFVTVFTVYTGVIYFYENRNHLKNILIAFYRVFIPTNVR